MINRIRNDMNLAMKSGDKRKKDALSALLNALLNAEKAQMKPLNEAEAFQVIKKEIKQQQETFSFATDRKDIANECQFRISLYKSYIPSDMTDEQIGQEITKVLTEFNVQNPTKSQIMRLLMPRVKGKADGKRVSDLVDERLKK